MRFKVDVELLDPLYEDDLRKIILEILEREGGMTVAELARYLRGKLGFCVSEERVRRVLWRLGDEGLVRRDRSGRYVFMG